LQRLLHTLVADIIAIETFQGEITLLRHELSRNPAQFCPQQIIIAPCKYPYHSLNHSKSACQWDLLL
jgi:hypothetical protein